jgi:hypothetical protein
MCGYIAKEPKEYPMAANHHFICTACKKSKDEFGAPGKTPTVCASCTEKAAAKEKLAALATLKALPLEERLSRLEASLYDLKHAKKRAGYESAMIGTMMRF